VRENPTLIPADTAIRASAALVCRRFSAPSSSSIHRPQHAANQRAAERSAFRQAL